MLAKDSNERVVLKADRVEYWLKSGAKPTDRVAKFIEQAGIALPEKVKKEMEVKLKNRKAKPSKEEAKEA